MASHDSPKVTRRVRSAVAEMATRELLDSRRLFYFFHVARSGSFTAAETLLDVAQPAMTRQLQQLESEVGVQLLSRTGRGVVLTGAGQILYRHAEAIFNNMSTALEEIELSRRNPAGRLSIATPPTFSSMVMPEVIRRLLSKMPDVELSVLEASTGQVHDYLASGEVDLAVVLHAPNTQKVVLKKITTEPLCLIVDPSHPLAAAAEINRSQIADLELILPANAHGSRRLIEQFFAEAGRALTPALQIDSLPIIKAVIAQGPRFCSILPAHSCRQEIEGGRFKALTIRPALLRTLHLARMRDRIETPYIREITKQIMEVLQERIEAEDRRAG